MNGVCCACESALRQSTPKWLFECRQCGTWAANLPVDINGLSHAGLDEEQRGEGLASLRNHNNDTILSRLRELSGPRETSLLDVGSAHGWFLEQASKSGFEAMGLEPDRVIADQARSQGHKVLEGLFPEALEPDATFGVITFNDVLEHLPDPKAAVAASYEHLLAGGLLSINIPTSQGVVYRAASATRGTGPGKRIFERLWQVGLPSPHLWYFNADSLSQLCTSEGFEVVHSTRLDSLRRKGLWERAHYTQRPSPTSVAAVAAGYLASPILNSPRASDIMCLIFRKPVDA